MTPTINTKLVKQTKAQVEATIRKGKHFKGYLCGNKVNPYHINNGWHLGYYIEVDSIDAFRKEVERFETSLWVYTPELGRYPHYYEIVDANTPANEEQRVN